MSYRVLARKWRPRDFATMVGQEHVVRALGNALDADRVHHAFLFTGTRGVGKTTLARVLAKCLNCERGVSSTPCGECSACVEIDDGRFVDLIEVDAASRAKVDETRDLMDNVPFAPARGRYKVYLIDEVHMFSSHSFNALLKTLEEPPPHVKFLLATTDPKKLPVTVLSRCLQFNLKRLAPQQIAAHLETILGAEGVAFEPAALRLIARAADGSMRDGLSLLDQAIAYCAGPVTEEATRSMLGTLPRERIYRLVRAVADNEAPAVVGQVAEMAAEAIDFEGALQELLSVLQKLALVQLVPDAATEDIDDRDALTALAASLSPEDVQLLYQIGLMGRRDFAFAPDPRTGFEMLLLRMLAFRPALDEEPPAGRARSASAAPAPAPPKEQPRAAPRAAPSSEALGDAHGWGGIIAGLEVSGMVRQLAENSVLLGHEGDVLTLQLAPANAHLNTRNLADKLAQALGERFGKPVQLRVKVGDSSAQTPAGAQREVEAARRKAAVRAIETDPHVHAICEAFDAVIDRDSIEPRGAE